MAGCKKARSVVCLQQHTRKVSSLPAEQRDPSRSFWESQARLERYSSWTCRAGQRPDLLLRIPVKSCGQASADLCRKYLFERVAQLDSSSGSHVTRSTAVPAAGRERCAGPSLVADSVGCRSPAPLQRCCGRIAWPHGALRTARAARAQAGPGPERVTRSHDRIDPRGDRAE